MNTDRAFRASVLLLILTVTASGALHLYAQPTPPKDVPPVVKTADPLIPLKLTVGAGDPVILDGSKAKGNVKWLWHGNAKSVVIDGKKLTFSSAKEGTYKVGLISWDDQTYDTCTITVGMPVTPPDDPPAVTLDSLSKQITALTKIVQQNTNDIAVLQKGPPVPVDPFQAKVQAAYVADNKDIANVKRLAALYASSAAIVNDTTNKTPQDIINKMHTAIVVLLKEPDPARVTVLPNVRRALEAEFNANIGGNTKDMLTPALLVTINAEFAKAQAALAGVQP